MKYKKLSLLFHVGMNVGSTAEKITSQDICDYNLPLSTVYMLNRWSLYHPSSRYRYLFGGNTWSLKTLLATNDLCPDIFLSGFGIHISCSLFLLFTSSEMYQIVWNFSFFAGKWVACILYHRDLELSCDGLWFCHSHGFVYPFLLFVLGPLFCFPVGSLSCLGWSQLILSTWSFICR